MRSLFAVLALLLAAPAWAESNRELKDHLFQYPLLQSSAFVHTEFSIRQGLALYEADLSLEGIEGVRPLELVGMTDEATLSVKVAEWIAVEADLQASSIIGNNARSLLLRGSQFDLSGDLGLVARLFRSEESGTQVSFRANGGYGGGRRFSALRLVGKLIESPVETAQAVVEGDLRRLVLVPTRTIDAGAGFYAAQALSRTFGLQASLAVAGVRIREILFEPPRGEFAAYTRAISLRAGLAATADLDSVGVPVAFVGEYVYAFGERTEQVGPDTQLRISSLGLGIFYSGREELQLGIGGSVTLNGAGLLAIGPNGGVQVTTSPTLTTGQFVFRYFW